MSGRGGPVRAECAPVTRCRCSRLPARQDGGLGLGEVGGEFFAGVSQAGKGSFSLLPCGIAFEHVERLIDRGENDFYNLYIQYTTLAPAGFNAYSGPS